MLDRRAFIAGALALAVCGSAEAQPQFQPARFLGTWHEIARIDHVFEAGLTQVTARYGKLPDGQVSVENRGWDASLGQWRSIAGTARFIGDPQDGQLRVTLGTPWAAGLKVAAFAPDYSWAVLTGDFGAFAWLLARSPNPSKTARARMIGAAAAAGIAPERFTFIR
jgi:apolipoprotein D and lipocalin family protein